MKFRIIIIFIPSDNITRKSYSFGGVILNTYCDMDLHEAVEFIIKRPCLPPANSTSVTTINQTAFSRTDYGGGRHYNCHYHYYYTPQRRGHGAACSRLSQPTLK